MFADPQTITLVGTQIPLARISTRDTSSVYSNPDSTIQLRSSHTNGKRTRRSFRLDQRKISPDVFLPAQNVQSSMSCYVVFDHPAAGGFDITEMKALYTALNLQLTANSSLVLTAFLGGSH
jgi:hypothetical protein